MKKSLILVAATGLLSGAALAQSSVVIYGIVDAGLVRESGGAAGSVTNLGGGVASGSRIGFKGKEDLGGGLSANFLMENGFNTNNGAQGQGGLLFGRQVYVGLSGDIGSLTLGRQYSPYYKVLRDVADPFAAGFAGRAGNIMATNTRVNNMVEYVTPSFAGFSADLAWGLGGVADDAAKNRNLGAAVGYANGPVVVKLAHHQTNNATATDKTRNTLLAGSYNFGVALANLGYAVNKGTGTADSKDLIAGVSVPLGSSTLLASYIRHDDRTVANRDANQWALGYSYRLSKRTDLYAAYARISNSNGATFTVGNATDTGTGDKAFNLGVRHSF
jgi:predicted porin